MRHERPGLLRTYGDRAAQLRLLWRIVFAAVIAFTLWQALEPGGAPADDLKDKLWHVAAFYTLGWTGALAAPRTSVALLFAVLTALGVGIELAQTYAPLHRTADPLDLQADLIGLSAAFLPMAVTRWRRL